VHRDTQVSRSGGRPGQDDADKGPPLPLRATAIVLSVWVIAMVLLALVVVPILFATCFPPPAS